MNGWSPGRMSATGHGPGCCGRRLVTSSCASRGADREVLPVAAGTAPAGRSGPVGGDHDRLRDRHLDPQGRRPGLRPGLFLTWTDGMGCWTYMDGAAGVDAEPVGGLLGG